MNFFNFDLKKWLLFALVISLPLISINIEQRRDRTGLWYTNPLSYMGSFTQDLFFMFSTGVVETTQMYLNLINVKKENIGLHNENNEIKTLLTRFRELELENQRLRQLVDFRSQTKMNLVAAKVVGRDLVTDHKTVTINKGVSNGLKSGMAVMTVKGVLGYVFKPDAFTSHVMLITDRYAVVDAIIQRSRAHGIVEGRNQSNLQLQYVDRTEDVQPGDMVVTGGLDNIFPKGFPIAIVDTVERKTKSVSLKIDLKPVVDPNTAEEVYVVTDAANEDIKESLTAQVQPQKMSLELRGSQTPPSVPTKPNIEPAKKESRP